MTTRHKPSHVQPLPKTSRSDGFDFQVLRRHGRVAILSKQESSHGPKSYEAVVLQTRPAECIFGRELPAREVMPPSESWGTHGWSYAGLGEAAAKFNQLIRARRKRRFPPKGSGASASELSLWPSAATKVLTPPTTP